MSDPGQLGILRLFATNNNASCGDSSGDMEMIDGRSDRKSEMTTQTVALSVTTRWLVYRVVNTPVVTHFACGPAFYGLIQSPYILDNSNGIPLVVPCNENPSERNENDRRREHRGTSGISTTPQ